MAMHASVKVGELGACRFGLGGALAWPPLFSTAPRWLFWFGAL